MKDIDKIIEKEVEQSLLRRAKREFEKENYHYVKRVSQMMTWLYPENKELQSLLEQAKYKVSFEKKKLTGKIDVVVTILKNIPKLIQSSFPPASSLMPLPTRGKSSSVQLPVIEGMISSRRITGWIIYFPKQNVSSILLSITDAVTKEGLAGVTLNLFDSKGKKLLGGKTDNQGKIMFHEQMHFGKYVIKSKDKDFIDLEITIKRPAK